MTDINSNIQSVIPVSEDLRKLKGVITDMDCLSQEGLAEIEAVTRLVLRVMESPNVNESDHGYIIHALHSIRKKADDTMNYINYQAESVSCNWRNEVAQKRSQGIHS